MASSTATRKSSTDEPATKATRAKGLGPSPRARKKAEAAPSDADKAEQARLRRNAYTRAWRARKAEAAKEEAPARRPYPDTVSAPQTAREALVSAVSTNVVLTLPLTPGARATRAEVLATLRLMTRTYGASLKATAPAHYARIEGTLAGLRMAEALVEMLEEK